MKLPRRATAVIAGVALGLFAIEGAFRLRDHGAFPHLNIYLPDAKLGVRLHPRSVEKISFSGNPVSHVHINAQGYRGADWPMFADATDEEIFVVGDSQAFGLGVEEADAFAWKLGALLHRRVANAAVPTYGPGEYNAVLAKWLPSHHPKTVVYTVNLANDLFEASHPNVTRHAVWDGWAVRRETAPLGVHHFPGRRLLFNESHAFFALRGLWWKLTGSTDEGRVASEGGWQDLVALDREGSGRRAQTQLAAERDQALRDEAIRTTMDKLRRLDFEIERTPEGTRSETLLTAAANPGDIVMRSTAESARPVAITAAEIARAAAARHAYEGTLRARNDVTSLANLVEHDRLIAKLRELGVRVGSDDQRTTPSPLYTHLARAKQLCDDNDAELVVLVLPLDVQVSDREWDKYDAAKKLDLSASRILDWDVLEAARELGVRTVDAWPVLAAAEPDAFLKGDLHMSPKGHAHVAEALARLLRTPARAPLPLPQGRTAVPAPSEWAAAPTGFIGYLPAGRSPTFASLGCVAREVREWVRIDCAHGAFVLEDQGAETLVLNHADGGTLIYAGVPGGHASASFLRVGKRVTVRWAWPLNQPSRLYLFGGEVIGAAQHVPAATDGEAALCECERELTGAAQCDAIYGSAEPGCARAYGSDCEQLLACARADRRTPPTCDAGETMTPTTLRCVASKEPR